MPGMERGAAVANEDASRRFAEVVVPHLDAAYALARWLTGNSADAEDVVQDAAMRAFSGISGFLGGSARAWTLSVVRNAAYTWLKKNRGATLVFTDDIEADEPMPVSSDAMTPEADMIARQDGDRLRAALEKLPLAFREALVMRELQGLSYREIVAVTGLPIGTVMSRLARARRLMMAALQEKT
jgi:RNA polymerase sigma factor (sigma-70 family)